jgi:hypothetical protein
MNPYLAEVIGTAILILLGNKITERLKTWSEFLNKQNMSTKINQKNIFLVGVSFKKDWFKHIRLPENCKFHSITWNKVCWLKSHPDAMELLNYYLWKRNLCLNKPSMSI